MALVWITFFVIKTLGSYIILLGIFYQLLIQNFSFYLNVYITIDNMIITNHCIVVFLPSIFHIINLYFEFIKPYWLINSKRQPRWNLLKRYRKKLYRQKIKIRKFFPTNNQLIENTDDATRPITNKLPNNWDELFKKPLWTATKGIPVQHRKTMENPAWLFRGIPQGKQQLTFLPDRGGKFPFYWDKYISSAGASRS